MPRIRGFYTQYFRGSVLIFFRLIEDHKKWKEEEAALVEQDRSTAGPNGGLFRGCFKSFARRPIIRAHPIRDAEDGVERCPACTWELEDGRCESCGYSFETDTDIMSDSDMDYPHGVDMDHEVLEVLGEEDLVHHQMYGGGHYDDGETSEDIPFTVPRPGARRRVDYSMMNPELHGYDVSPTLASGSPPDSFYDGTNYGSEDDDDSSSLEGFVVDDDPHIDRVSPQGSPRSLQWETDEGSGSDENQVQDTDNERNIQADNDPNQHYPSIAIAQYHSDGDSDEGHIARTSRRQGMRSSAGSSGSEASQPLRSIRNRSSRNINPSQNQRNIPHRSTDARRNGGRSRGVPIEIASDSDSPVPPQRQRRRRGLLNRILSDDDSGVDASSGTATLGRQSPQPGPGLRNQRINRSAASLASNGSSPILVVSDEPVSENEGLQSRPEHSRSASVAASTPERSIANGEEDHTFLFQGHEIHSPGEGSPTHITSHRDHNHLSPHSQPRHRQPNRRQSPLPPHPNRNGASRPSISPMRQSPLPPRPNRNGASRPSISPMRPQERFEQGVRDRAAAKAAKKADRRRLKAERDQRQRSQAGPSNASSQNHPSWSFDD